MKLDIKVNNIGQVQKDFNKLLRVLTPAEANKILRAGANIVTRSVRSQTPIGPTGKLRKAVKTKTLRVRSDGRTAVISAIDRKKAPHAGLVAFGTKARYTKSGRYTGVMPKDDFFDRGVQTAANSALSKVIEGVKKKVEGAAR